MAKPETRNSLWLRLGDPIHGERLSATLQIRVLRGERTLPWVWRD